MCRLCISVRRQDNCRSSRFLSGAGAVPSHRCSLRALPCAAPICYAAAVGAVTGRADVPLGCALTGYLQAMAANLLSAGLRLGFVGQTDGQRILAALEPVVGAAVAGALVRGPDQFGSATSVVDLVSMAHETQYTRLFRS